MDKNDPFVAVDKYLDLRKHLFNFYQSEMDKTGEKSFQVRIFNLGNIEEGLDEFLFILGVQIEELVKYNGGKEIKVESRHEVREGDKILLIDLAWN